jgi:glycolate oxidase iron-sulfur subunit
LLRPSPSSLSVRRVARAATAVLRKGGDKTALAVSPQRWAHRPPPVRRWLAAQTIPFPSRFRLALRGAALGRALGGLVPAVLRPMLALAPATVPPAVALPRVTPALGERRARVALLAGCAQQVLDPDINVATLSVLARNGVEVIIPPAQGCCGGLAWHTGELAAAQAFARRNLDAFPADVDAILTNAAGCGSAMHEYHLVLRGTPDEARALAFTKKVVDVSVFLARLGLRGIYRPSTITTQAHKHNPPTDMHNIIRLLF